MTARRAVAWLLALVLVFGSAGLMPAGSAYATDGSVSFAPADQGCGTKTWNYEPGKTETGFEATATDGCHTYRWTSNTTDVTGSGKLTFKTVGNVQPWESGYTLPGPQGGNFCEYRAAQEANGWMTNDAKVPPGTEVTVTYRCF